MSCWDWLHRVVNGPTGYLSKCAHEPEEPTYDGLAEFVIRALGNVECEGSDYMLESIMDHRKRSRPRAKPGRMQPRKGCDANAKRRRDGHAND